MKLRVGACALMLVLAGCSGESTESGVAGMRDVAASKTAGSLPVSLPLARAISDSIANAPDRGALLSYPNKATPSKQQGAYTWYPTAISEAHALKGIATGEMTVPSPDGSQVKLRYERHVEEIDGNWTWIGRVVGGDQMQEAIITFGENAVFGSIPQADGKPALSLQTRNGAVFAVQTDPSKAVSATKGHVDVMVPEAAALRSSMAAAVSQAAPVSQAAVAVAQGAPPNSLNTIDIAIGYTPEFAAANSGASGAATRLVYLVQVGNQAFQNSGVNGYLRIVHALQVSYTSSNSNQTALTELTGSNGQSPVTVPSGLAPLRTARNTYGADIAVLVRKFNTPENQGCGIAWLNGANGPSEPTQPPISQADAGWGYAVISDGYDTGSDDKEYYCADETLVHEVAHLMGSAHDRANSRDSEGGLQYGAYSYSFGYKTAASAGNFYTIMAYGDVGQTAHRIFSTPLKNTCVGNRVCGVANSEDNARSLNLTIPIVAQFRETVVPFAGVRGDIDGDGKSDIVLRHGSLASGNLQVWTMNGATRLALNSYTQAQTWRVAGIADFNGDGLADILWDSPSTRQLIVSLSQPGGGFSGAAAGTYLAGWTVAGTGDISGDGKADIVFWNGQVASGNLKIWMMNGATKSSEKSFTQNASFTIAGIGDVNGDGRADIIWSAAAQRQLSVSMTKADVAGFSGAVIGTHGNGWVVVGVADVDGNGTADIIMRKQSLQADNVAVWLLNGGTTTRKYSLTKGTSWVVSSVADFNGDGKADVLWNSSSRQFNMWLSRTGSTTTFDNVGVTGYEAGWTPVPVR